MEDQQPASGDLTEAGTVDGAGGDTPVVAAASEDAAEDAAGATTEATAPESATAGEAAGGADPSEATTPDEAAPVDATTGAGDDRSPGDAATEASPGVTPKPKARSRNKTAVLAIAAVATFVFSSALAAAAVEPYVVSRAAVVTKMTIANTAAEAINTLWTYTPEDMDALPDRAAKYLSGDFEDQYRKFVDAIAATNKQAQVSNSTEVVAAAVESVNGDDATALVYTNTTSSTPQAAIPTIKYVSYRLQLKRKGTQWLVTKMTTVTSLDLTPKL